MSSPSKETEEPTSSTAEESNEAGGSGGQEAAAGSEEPRPPAKRRLSSTVIEISDTESDDSDVCAVTSYQASADEVKRIRGEDYSSSSSSSDYSSDSESPWEDDSILVEDTRPLRKAVRAQLNPRANRMDNPKFNPALKSQELMDKLKAHWTELKDHSDEHVTLTCDPFRLCLLHDLLANAEIINNIIDDMNTLDWSRKKMDLYEYHQTADLASLTWQRGIKGIYELLKTEVMSWVAAVTGLELRSVSASCALYGPGDHLLPHDDRLADRRVAFILYLAPWHPPKRKPLQNGSLNHHEPVDVETEARGWAEHMGGALELLAESEVPAEGEGEGAGAGPGEGAWSRRVGRRVLPANNALAFFQVGARSLHQVTEVVSLELPRLTINGWFHGPPPAADGDEEPEPAPPPPPISYPPHNEVVVLSQWVEPTYMSPRNRGQIQAQMERDSEVCLTRFLLPARRLDLLAALRHPDVPWEEAGPAQARRYRRLPAAWARAQGAAGAGAGAAGQLLQLAGSAAFCRLLADCTDLRPARLARLELQRWTPQCYTLLPPREHYQEPRLELVLYLGVPPRPLCGGGTTYVAPEDAGGAAGGEGGERGEGGEGAEGAEGGALVTVAPRDNALSLVYCDAGAAGFTKYLSRMTMRPDDDFFILTCAYSE